MIRIKDIANSFKRTSVSRLVTKIIKMYLAIMAKNVINGYQAILPHGIIIEARMYNNFMAPLSRAVFFSRGEKIKSVNPHFPNKRIRINIFGIKAERYGYEFNAFKALRKPVSENAYNGFKYMTYE